MTDAFAAAATALAADPNLGVDATWTSRLGGASVAVRVVPSAPEAAYAAGEGPSVAGVVASAVIPAAGDGAIPGRPERGDLMVMNGTDYTVAEVMQDARGVSYRVHLRRA